MNRVEWRRIKEEIREWERFRENRKEEKRKGEERKGKERREE